MGNKAYDDFLICCDGSCPRKERCYRYQTMMWLIRTDNSHDRRYKSVPLGECRAFGWFRDGQATGQTKMRSSHKRK